MITCEWTKARSSDPDASLLLPTSEFRETNFQHLTKQAQAPRIQFVSPEKISTFSARIIMSPFCSSREDLFNKFAQPIIMSLVVFIDRFGREQTVRFFRSIFLLSNVSTFSNKNLRYQCHAHSRASPSFVSARRVCTHIENSICEEISTLPTSFLSVSVLSFAFNTLLIRVGSSALLQMQKRADRHLKSGSATARARAPPILPVFLRAHELCVCLRLLPFLSLR
jgi:hypothetical protein